MDKVTRQLWRGPETQSQVKVSGYKSSDYFLHISDYFQRQQKLRFAPHEEDILKVSTLRTLWTEQENSGRWSLGSESFGLHVLDSLAVQRFCCDSRYWKFQDTYLVVSNPVTKDLVGNVFLCMKVSTCAKSGLGLTRFVLKLTQTTSRFLLVRNFRNL